jgi:hypothetical protein
MPFSSDRVVVSFAEFLERRELRRHIAAALGEGDRDDVGASGVPEEPRAQGATCVSESSVATDEVEDGTEERLTVSVPDRSGLPNSVPR